MTALIHGDVQNSEFQEVQGWEKTLYDYQIPIALLSLAALFVAR